MPAGITVASHHRSRVPVQVLPGAIKELARATGLSRNTIRRALRSDRPPSYARAPRPSVLEPFKPEIHRLLKADPKLPGVRIRELLEPLQVAGVQAHLKDVLGGYSYEVQKKVLQDNAVKLYNLPF